MQAGNDQDAVQDAVDEQPGFARSEYRAAQAVHAAFERGPAPAEGRSENEPCDAGHDRHEAPAAEESQVAGQPYFAVAVVKDTREVA